jgi:hypothetical protein
VPGQLVRTELALTKRGDSLPSLRQLKIGEMARWTRHDGSVPDRRGWPIDIT